MDLEQLRHRYGFFPCLDTKAPDTQLGGDHNRFRTNGHRPTANDIAAWVGRPIGLWCGENALQLIDVDEDGYFAPFLAACEDNGLAEVLEKCAIVETAHGHHVWCNVPGCLDGNQKLAMHAQPEWSMERAKEVQVIIETRGLGGYGLIPPSPGYRYEGKRTVLDLVPLTIDEWRALVSVARLFDERPVTFDEPKPVKGEGSGVRPGDDYAKRGPSIADMLSGAGWRIGRRTTGGRTSVTRPGKSDPGISGTITADGQVFYCFSSNAHPFEPDKGYSHFSVYALLEHGGDYSAAAKKLSSMGYGETAEARTFDVVRESSSVPVIETNNVPHEATVGESLAALALYNAGTPTVFVRAGQIVEVGYDEEQRAMVRAVSESRLTYLLSIAARYVSTSQKRGCVHVVPPPAVVRSILSMPNTDWLPPLASISQAPALGRSGALALKRGYCPESRLFVATELGWKVAKKSGVDAARWILSEVLADFPFQAAADKANALGLMVLTVVRPYIDGPTPLHLFDAPTQGTGKSLCASVCAFPAIGRRTPAMTAPAQEEEWAKALLSMMAASRPVVLIDNISRKVDSDSLAAALTSDEYEARILGGSTIGTYPVRCVWIGTSNNAQLSGDIARRTVSIRLDAGVERPWQRETFKHSNILGWLKENRVEVMANLLAMVEAWREAGYPSWSGRPLGSFEEWSRTIGGILDTCKVNGFLDNWEVMYESTNVEEVSWAGFYQRWYERYGVDPVKAGDLYELAQQDEILMAQLGSGNEQSQKIRLGSAIRKRVRRVCGGFVVSVDGKTHKVFRFKLTPSVGVGGSLLLCPKEYPEEDLFTDGRDTPVETVESTPKHPQHPPDPSPRPDGVEDAEPAAPERSLADQFMDLYHKYKEGDDDPFA